MTLRAITGVSIIIVSPHLQCFPGVVFGHFDFYTVSAHCILFSLHSFLPLFLFLSYYPERRTEVGYNY